MWHRPDSKSDYGNAYKITIVQPTLNRGDASSKTTGNDC